MEKQSLINKITTIVDELKDLTNNFSENDNIPQIDIDLSLEKVRKLYDRLIKLKAIKDDIVEYAKPVENVEEKKEEIAEVTSPVVEYKEEPKEEFAEEVVDIEKIEEKEEIIEQVTTDITEQELKEPEIIETKAETFNTPIRTNASQTSLFESSNETYKHEQTIEESIQEEINETIPPVVEYTAEPVEDTIEEKFVEDEKSEEIIDNSLNFENDIKETEPEVLFQEEVKEEKINIIKEETPQAKTIGENLIDNKKNINDYFAEFKKTKDLATHLQYQPIKNLKSVISLNDKIRFIKELFGSSSEKYAMSIEKLDSFSNLDEALEYLNNNFEWDDNKASFKDFLELIYRRYLPVL